MPSPAAVAADPGAFVDLLRGLDPSGPDGYEGWVADALSELTGRSFRLVKPGPQGGADLLSGTAAGEAVLAVEAKRFREDTQLPLDALLAKVVDLAQTRPEADLWVLAATRQIPADDVAKLEAAGQRHGLDVLVVDTRPGADGLSPLEVLGAAAPGAAASHFPGRPDLYRHLEAIRSLPRFAAALERLRGRLSSPEIGYDAARTGMALRLRGAMADLATAKGELGSHADLLAHGGQPAVDRIGAAAHLSAAVSDPSQVRALLGGEGVGKTWAVLRWWDAAAGPDGLGLPLTVWLPAARVASGGDLVAAACAALAERTGRGHDRMCRKTRVSAGPSDPASRVCPEPLRRRPCRSADFRGSGGCRSGVLQATVQRTPMIVQACLNGARPAAYHPALPSTADAMAADAAACVAAGAAELHLHPRGPDGRESLAPAVVDATVLAVRRTCPGTLVGVSTGAWIEGDADRTLARIEGWRELPDHASVNLSEPGAPAVMERLWRRGIGVEAGLASVADAGRLVALGLGLRALRVMVEIEEQNEAEALAVAEAIEAVLAHAGLRRPVLLHGLDATVWGSGEQRNAKAM